MKQLILILMIIIVIGTIVICLKLEQANTYSLDYQIETYTDKDGTYKVLRDSNGDTVYLKEVK